MHVDQAAYYLAQAIQHDNVEIIKEALAYAQVEATLAAAAALARISDILELRD